jgi:hypothetical protein
MPKPRRTCAKTGCITLLSKSNDGPLCHAHTPIGTGKVVRLPNGEYTRTGQRGNVDPDVVEVWRELMGEYD